MTATVHPLATDAALEILAARGNAVDAAVAATFAISVTSPFDAGLGGGGFAVVHLEGSDRCSAPVCPTGARASYGLVCRMALW